jgi:hypothetical protein
MRCTARGVKFATIRWRFVKYSFTGSDPGISIRLDSESRSISYDDVNVIVFDASHAVPGTVRALAGLTRGASRSPSWRHANKRFSFAATAFIGAGMLWLFE